MPNNILVSRHPGAIEWVKLQGICIHTIRHHLIIDDVRAGDRVFGVLPIHMIAAINAIGADYFHIVVSPTPDMRGKEWTVAQLITMQAYLQGYIASAHPHEFVPTKAFAPRTSQYEIERAEQLQE